MARNALIWKVTPLDRPKVTSYIMGTMHVRDRRAFVVAQQATQCIENSSLFLSEVNLDEMVSPNSVFTTEMEEGRNLTTLLGRKHNKVKNIILKSFDIDITSLDTQVPLLLINYITERILEAESTESLDLYLWQKAKNLGVVCDGIETLAEHFNTLVSIPLEVQTKMLLRLAGNVNSYRKNILRLIQCYQTKQLHRLYMLAKADLGQLKEIMLYDRNRLMAESALQKMANESVFLAVGAAHLPGEKGLIHLLNQQGMRVSPYI